MAHDLQLDLDVLIPEAHDHSDRCVSELMELLRATDGVEDVHIIEPSGGSPARLCVSIGSGRVSVRRLAERARTAGAEISARYGHVVWQLRGITHSTRAANARMVLQRMPGVLDAVVTTGGRSRIEFDRNLTTEAELWHAATAAGLTIEPVPAIHSTGGEGRADGHRAGDLPRTVPGSPLPDDRSGTVREPGAHDDRRDASRGDHGVDDRAPHDHTHDHAHGGPSELVVAAVAFVVYLVTRISDWRLDLGHVPLVVYVVITLVTGYIVGRDMVATLRARRLDIEMLMIAAAVGAAVLGHWSDAALLLTLFSLGHGLEAYAMERARREIESLGDLAPPVAHRRDDGTITDVDPLSLVVGDVLVVKPNERIPADGVVVEGHSTVDESPVTGESIPVEKSPVDEPTRPVDFDTVAAEHRVFAGTLNGPRALEVRVGRTSDDSTLARVIQLVTEAETQISPTQRVTHRIVRIFVPSVLALVTLAMVLPLAFGAPFEATFMRAMAMLVASSPCALAIAIPSAVLSAIARAAREGVLIKGGGPLEILGQVCVVAFDKTGTLTSGSPTLVAVEPEVGVDRAELLSVAVAVEALSDHPLARAIVTGAGCVAPDGGSGDPGAVTPADTEGSPPSTPEVTEVTAEVGRGVTALVDGRRIAIGNAAMFDDVVMSDHLRSRWAELENSGCTTMAVCRDGTPMGLLGVIDATRPEAATTVRQLKDLGIHHTIMLSGDHQRVADAVARHVGVDEALGGLLPEDKVAEVRRLRAEHSRGIAMVGDGVNDAPALGAANVGIAMGAAGSAVALETADIALMGDRLDKLPFAVRLARSATRTIVQNLVMSLGMVAVLIPLTLVGVGIGPAVIAHEGSTLVVVANALRLLAHRDRHDTAGRS